MSDTSLSLSLVYDGWAGYNVSLIHAVEGLTAEQLGFRPGEGMKSVGEIAAHIAFGRIDWFACLGAPGSAELVKRAAELPSKDAVNVDAFAIVKWLSATWSMIEDTLAAWTVDDLDVFYEHEYWGNVYGVSRQWTIWRIMAHDIQHGGQLTILLSMQGIAIPELGDLGGHLAEPPIIRKA